MRTSVLDRFLETSFESTVLALLAIAAIFEDYDSMRTERQALFLSSLALSNVRLSEGEDVIVAPEADLPGAERVLLLPFASDL